MQMTECESAVLEAMVEDESTQGEFCDTEALASGLEGYSAAEVRRALHGLEDKQFVVLRPGQASITEMGIAAIKSM